MSARPIAVRVRPQTAGQRFVDDHDAVAARALDPRESRDRRRSGRRRSRSSPRWPGPSSPPRPARPTRWTARPRAGSDAIDRSAIGHRRAGHARERGHAVERVAGQCRRHLRPHVRRQVEVEGDEAVAREAEILAGQRRQAAREQHRADDQGQRHAGLRRDEQTPGPRHSGAANRPLFPSAEPRSRYRPASPRTPGRSPTAARPPPATSSTVTANAPSSGRSSRSDRVGSSATSASRWRAQTYARQRQAAAGASQQRRPRSAGGGRWPRGPRRAPGESPCAALDAAALARSTPPTLAAPATRISAASPPRIQTTPATAERCPPVSTVPGTLRRRRSRQASGVPCGQVTRREAEPGVEVGRRRPTATRRARTSAPRGRCASPG